MANDTLATISKKGSFCAQATVICYERNECNNRLIIIMQMLRLVVRASKIRKICLNSKLNTILFTFKITAQISRTKLPHFDKKKINLDLDNVVIFQTE